MNTRNVLGELREIRRSCEKLIERIETEPEDGAQRGIDQRESDLGPKRHCEAVRRRRKEGKTDAFKVGRRHLLTREAYVEELGATERRRLAKAVRRRPAGAEPCPADNDTSSGVADEVQAMRNRIARKLGRLK